MVLKTPEIYTNRSEVHRLVRTRAVHKMYIGVSRIEIKLTREGVHSFRALRYTTKFPKK